MSRYLTLQILPFMYVYSGCNCEKFVSQDSQSWMNSDLVVAVLNIFND